MTSNQWLVTRDLSSRYKMDIEYKLEMCATNVGVSWKVPATVA